MASKRSRAGGPGRPSKGPRDVFLTRLPPAHASAVRTRAEELDLSYSECIADLLAEAFGLPLVSTMTRDRDQEELPLTQAS